MPREGEPLPRPTPRTPYVVRVRNRQVRDDWEVLLRTRRDVMIRCWDHIANTPQEPIGDRYTRLKGEQASCEFQGRRLPQWQWELDRRARIKIGVSTDFVVVMSALAGHPKENE
jgi:hypothetical protein